MDRTVETFRRRIREELRAEGPDGAGYSDFMILSGINAALDDLSEIFNIRDVIEFKTQAGKNTYDLTELSPAEVYDIIRIEYDGTRVHSTSIDDYLDLDITEEGPVRSWFLWGRHITFVGEVEDDIDVNLWVARSPHHLYNKGDAPETPRYADEAIIAYAVSTCYRESKDYDRANYHFRVYTGMKQNLLNRGVPQLNKDSLPVMRATYMGPFRPKRGFIRTDRNPGGEYS